MPFEDDDQERPKIKPRMAAAQNPMEVPTIASPQMNQMKPAVSLPGIQVPTQTQTDTNELNRLKTTGSGISQIHNPFLKTLATIGDVASNVISPGLSSRIPGTMAHHNQLVNNQEGIVKNDLEQGLETARTTAQDAATKHVTAETTALEDKPALVDKHLGSYVNANGKNVDKFQKADGSTYEKESGDVNQKDPAPKTVNTKEDLIRRIHEAYEAGDPATVKNLQGELKAIGDPYAQTKIEISQQGATDRHDSSEQKKKDAVTKQVAPLQTTLDEAQHAHEMQKMADKGNAEADVDLALSFFKVMRQGGQGIRFTKQEQDLILGARNSAGDLTGFAQKVVGGGQKFTPQQRKQIVDIIDSHARIAKTAMDRIQGGDASQITEQAGQPKAGDIVDGYKFKGGDPSVQANWEKK